MENLPDKGILQSQALLEYIYKTSVYPQEHEQLRQLREATVQKYKHRSLIATAIDEAQFMGMLLKLMNANKTLEVGVFTGYSLLTTALALPQHGKVTAIDIDREAYEIGLPFIRKAGVEHKINFIHSDFNSAINDLLPHEEGTFDFIFMDADKKNYKSYHEALVKLVKVGGVIAYDNTLWFGSVALPEDEPMSDLMRERREQLMNVNAYLTSDPRVESILLSIGDGLTLCRRLHP